MVGSSIGDNWSVDTGRGIVRAYDARTGAQRWRWDPIPYVKGQVGAANAWAPISADPERDMVFVPTSVLCEMRKVLSPMPAYRNRSENGGEAPGCGSRS